MKFKYSDILIFIFFLLIVILFKSSELDQYSQTIQSSDGEAIANMAAAKDHPDLFSNDYLYGDLNNFRFYTPLYIKLVQIGSFNGGYRGAFKLLFIAILLLHLWGYYWLGWKLSRNKIVGVLFSLLTLLPMIILFESWGISGEGSAIPRNLFSALLPFILVLFFQKDLDNKKWRKIFIFSGLTVYAYPVAAPFIGMVCILGYINDIYTAKNDKNVNWKNFLLLFLIWMIVIAPYALLYSIYHSHGTVPKDMYGPLMEILKFRFDPMWFHPGQYIIASLRDIWDKIGLASILFVPSLVLAFYKRNEAYLGARVGVLLAALLIVSLILPSLDHAFSYYAKKIPYEIDLVRNIRYLIPVIYLGFPILWVQSEKFPKKIKNTSKFISIILVLLSVYVSFPSKIPIYIEFRWMLSYPFPPPQVNNGGKANLEMMQIIKNKTKPGAVFMSDKLAVRYVGLRPMYYHFKDGNLMGYANWNGLFEWKRRGEFVDQLNQTESLSDKVRMLRSEGIDYWLIETGDLIKIGNYQEAKKYVQFFNKVFVLLDLNRA